MKSTILAIESSCDDTSAAVIIDGRVASNVTAQQLVHSDYGGVVPELASRKHQINIVPVVQSALKQAEIDQENLDAIAFTRGPGLLGSLIVGVTFAKAMALSLNIPLIEVNHMQAHVLAHFAEKPSPGFPFLCLTVSGGHTQIVKVTHPLQMEIIGRTLDDAAGEAFDKTGKMLGLPYPAGPQIDKLAEQGKPIYQFPEPKIPGLDFSFSGLKTAIMYFIKDQLKTNPNFLSKEMENICASVQERIVSILINKIKSAVELTNITEVAVAGGVSANSTLRSAINQLSIEYGWQTFIPKIEYCTDNAAMIGIAAAFKYEKEIFAPQNTTPAPRLDFTS